MVGIFLHSHIYPHLFVSSLRRLLKLTVCLIALYSSVFRPLSTLFPVSPFTLFFSVDVTLSPSRLRLFTDGRVSLGDAEADIGS